MPSSRIKFAQHWQSCAELGWTTRADLPNSCATGTVISIITHISQRRSGTTHTLTPASFAPTAIVAVANLSCGFVSASQRCKFLHSVSPAVALSLGIAPQAVCFGPGDRLAPLRLRCQRTCPLALTLTVPQSRLQAGTRSHFNFKLQRRPAAPSRWVAEFATVAASGAFGRRTSHIAPQHRAFLLARRSRPRMPPRRQGIRCATIPGTRCRFADLRMLSALRQLRLPSTTLRPTTTSRGCSTGTVRFLPRRENPPTCHHDSLLYEPEPEHAIFAPAIVSAADARGRLRPAFRPLEITREPTPMHSMAAAQLHHDVYRCTVAARVA